MSVCASLLDDTLDGLSQQRKHAINLGADIIEFRLDSFDQIDLDGVSNLIKETPKDVILSVRSKWNDMEIEPPLSDRRETMERLIQLKPDYIDLEYPIDMPLLNKVKPSTIPILSMLDFDGMTKIAFDSLVSRISKEEKDVILKISCTPNSVQDLKLLFRWANTLNKENIPHVIIGMGQLGQITRIKSPELGNEWMYGRIGEKMGEPFLPGMMSINSLHTAFKPDAWHFGSLGQLPENDALRRIYEELLQAGKMDGMFINIPIKSSPDLDQMLLWIEDGLLDGVNISSPWQVDVLERLQHKDPSVIQMGSCNCVTITKDGLKGYNTQIEGMKRVLEPYGLKRFKRIYIEGTEPVARAVITLFKNIAETIVVKDLNYYEDDPIFDEFPEIIPETDSFSDHYDLVVNCSKPDRGFENVLMMRKSLIENAKLIFDPMSKISSLTKLMETAQQLDKEVLGGWEFFFHTAIRSFELWTKRSIPTSLLDKAIFNEYKDQIDFGFMLNY